MATPNWLAMGLALAPADEQADFINAFCSALVGVCKKNEGTQIWYMARSLDAGAEALMRELCQTREYHREQYRQDTLKRDELEERIRLLEDRKRKLEAGDGIS
jgi:hypothetical protein